MLKAVAPLRASPSDRRFLASGWANSETKRKSGFLITADADITTKYHKWDVASSGPSPPGPNKRNQARIFEDWHGYGNTRLCLSVVSAKICADPWPALFYFVVACSKAFSRFVTSGASPDCRPLRPIMRHRYWFWGQPCAS